MAKIAVQDNRITIGLDLGYGVVKAFTPTQAIAFPSVCGHARQMKFQAEDITARYPGDQIKDDEGSWFVGDLALSQLPPGELLRLRGRTANEATIGNVFRRRLAKVVIGKLLAGITHIAPHGRVSPGLVAVAEKAQVQFNESADRVDGVVVKPQGTQSLFGKLCPDQIVVVERHRPAGFELPSCWFADVVQQCRPAQHQIG